MLTVVWFKSIVTVVFGLTLVLFGPYVGYVEPGREISSSCHYLQHLTLLVKIS